MRTLTIDIAEVKTMRHRHRFYKWLSLQFSGSIIVEMGTFKGNSTRSWAHNKTNIVLTYDIIDRSADTEYYFSRVHNVLSGVEDCNDVGPEWFSKVAIIYLDVSHNGDDEALFLKRIDPYFKGILVMDDIDSKKHYSKLYDFFNGLEREHHLLPLGIAAEYGTGVVPYGDWTVVVKEES